MDIKNFIEEKRGNWRELEFLLHIIEKRGFTSLTVQQAKRFGNLYRAASTDLIHVKMVSANAEIIDYLNNLVARSYSNIYMGKKFSIKDMVDFYLVTFPKTFRNNVRFFIAATLLFFVGSLFSFGAMYIDTTAGHYLLKMGHKHLDPRERVEKEERGGQESTDDQRAAFSGMLFTHNIQVSFFVFALGISLGVGTVIVLFYNGVVLGAVAANYHIKGVSLFFWAWILPHGIIELTSIFIAGAAGLMIGWGMIAPGRLSFRESVKRRGKQAIHLMLGLIPMLVVAGFIEGSISQIHEPTLPYWLKIAFALVCGILLYYYLFFFNRKKIRMLKVGGLLYE